MRGSISEDLRGNRQQATGKCKCPNWIACEATRLASIYVETYLWAARIIGTWYVLHVRSGEKSCSDYYTLLVFRDRHRERERVEMKEKYCAHGAFEAVRQTKRHMLV